MLDGFKDLLTMSRRKYVRYVDFFLLHYCVHIVLHDKLYGNQVLCVCVCVGHFLYICQQDGVLNRKRK